jgi:hypothetical protein
MRSPLLLSVILQQLLARGRQLIAMRGKAFEMLR